MGDDDKTGEINAPTDVVRDVGTSKVRIGGSDFEAATDRAQPRTKTARRGSDRGTCPKCGFPRHPSAAVCKKCGLIFDKWAEIQKRQKAAEAEEEEWEEWEEYETSPFLAFLKVVAFAALLVIGINLLTGDEGPGPKKPVIEEPPVVEPPPVVEEPPVLVPLPPPPDPIEQTPPEYQRYAGRLDGTLELLETFDRKLVAGIGYNEMRREFLSLRIGIDEALGEPPSPHLVSYQAVQETLDAYAQSLSLWEYRVNATAYRGTLVCGTCPFETEQALKDRVGEVIQTSWRQARKFTALAAGVVRQRDPMAAENDAAALRAIRNEADVVDRAWRDLVVAGDRTGGAS